MAQQLFSNNVNSSLASGITNVAVAMTVASGEGSKFPNPTLGDWFLVTLYQLSGTTELNWEVVKCTARTGDVLTIVRAQESTSARAFNASDPVSMRFTAGSAANYLQAQNNLFDLTSVVNARISLGLQGMAVQNPASVAVTGGSVTGLTSLTTTGSTGIKNTAPAVALHVGDGTAQVTEKIHGAAAANLSPVLSMHRASVAEWARTIDASGTLHFSLNPASYTDANLLAGSTFRLKTDGTVGIGVDPVVKLSVGDGSAQVTQRITGGSAANKSPIIQFVRSGLTDWCLSLDTAGTLHFSKDTASFNDSALLTARKVTFDANGKVGIGITPSSQLHIYGSSGTTGAPVIGGGMLYAQDVDGSAGNGGGVLFGAIQGYFCGIKGSITNGGSNTQGDLIFYTRQVASDANLTVRLNINSAGSLLVNGAVEDGIHRVQIIGGVRAGNFHEAVAVKTTTYQILASDGAIIGDTSGGNFTVTLPSAAAAGAGYSCTVQIGTKGGNILTVAVPSGQVLNGTTNGSAALGAGAKQVTAISDGATNWYI